MAEGTVKFFNDDKGFGFIAPEGGSQDVFVHVSELRRSGIETLEEGQRVSFDVKMDPKRNKPNAVGRPGAGRCSFGIPAKVNRAPRSGARAGRTPRARPRVS